MLSPGTGFSKIKLPRCRRVPVTTPQATANCCGMHLEPVPPPEVRSRTGASAPRRFKENDHDTAVMCADLFCGIDYCRHPRIHRRFGGVRRCRPLSVLYLCRDLPHLACPRPDDLQGVAPQVTHTHTRR